MLGIDFTQITNMLPQIQEMGQQFLKAAEEIRDRQKDIEETLHDVQCEVNSLRIEIMEMLRNKTEPYNSEK